MMNNERYTKDDAYILLNRIEQWINNCDTKTSVLLGLLGIFFGLNTSIFEVFDFIKCFILYPNNFCFIDKVFIFVALFFVIVYITMIILCLFFSIKSINAKIYNIYKNKLFFGNIATSYESAEKYHKDITKMTQKKLQFDINEQIYINSKICTKKFKNYKKALVFLILSILTSIVCSILITFL